MKQIGLKFALLLSLLLNLGVIAAVAYRGVQTGQRPAVFSASRGETSLADHLNLTAGQRQAWQQLEAAFLPGLKSDWEQIRMHREAMIREIFSERPDRSRIERERAAIAKLQSEQQVRTVEQLLREREVLDREQRLRLAELLMRQAPASTFEERLHGR